MQKLDLSGIVGTTKISRKGLFFKENPPGTRNHRNAKRRRRERAEASARRNR